MIQPLISPLYDGKNVHEVVQLFFKENFDNRIALGMVAITRM